MPLVRSTEYEMPGASRNIESPENEHPRMSLQGFFLEGKHGGPPNLEQSRVRHQHHMYRMVLSGDTPLWGESIFQKKNKLNLAQPILYKVLFWSLLHMFSWGPDSIKLVSSKTNSFFEGGFMILFFPLGSALVERFCACVLFHFSIFDVLQTCCFHVSLLFVFGCSSAWWDRLRLGCKLSWFLSLKVVVASSFASPLEFTTKGREVENLAPLGPL